MQTLQRLKILLLKVVLLLNLVFIAHAIHADNYNYVLQVLAKDSTKKSYVKTYKSADKAERKQKKAEGKKLLKDSHSRFLIDV
jgi:hypothetical protein